MIKLSYRFQFILNVFNHVDLFEIFSIHLLHKYVVPSRLALVPKRPIHFFAQNYSVIFADTLYLSMFVFDVFDF